MKRRISMLIQLFCATACLCSLTIQASAQTALVSKVDGRQLAKRLCSNCHDVSPDANASIRRQVPSFRSIAQRPGQTEMRIAGAIVIPHPEMPNVPLTRMEIRNIVAYIQSLKAKKTQ